MTYGSRPSNSRRVAAVASSASDTWWQWSRGDHSARVPAAIFGNAMRSQRFQRSAARHDLSQRDKFHLFT